MPNIQTFEAGNLALQPSDLGVEAVAATGRRMGAYGSQIAQSLEQTGHILGQAGRDAGEAALAHVDHQQITEGMATGAQLFDNLTESKNAVIKGIDPEDPQYGQKVEAALKQWREEQLKPALDQFNQGFTTQRAQDWAEHWAGTTLQHMFVSTAADISTAANIGIRNSLRTFANTASNTALNDPSAMPALLDQADHSVAGVVSSSNLKGADAGRAQSEVLDATKAKIVKSAAFGYIQRTGQVPPWASDPKYSQYIDGTELTQLQKAAEVQNRTNLALQKQTQLYQRELDNQAVHVATNKAFNDNVSIDPQTGRAVINPQFFKDSLDIAHKYPNAPNAGSAVRTLLDWGETQQNKDRTTQDDPTTRQFNIDHMFDTDHPTTEIKILRDEAEGKLSRTTAAVQMQLVKALSEQPLKGPIWQDTMNAVKAELIVSVPGIPGKDSVGDANYAKFAQSFIPQYLAAVRSGNVPPNALDLKDPKSMISQAMAPFKRSVSDRMNDYTSVLGGLNPNGNITGPNTTVTGVTVQNAPAFKPPPTWQYSASRDQYKDPATNKIYDRAGHEVK